MKKLLTINLILVFILQFISQLYVSIPDLVFFMLYTIAFLFTNRSNILGVFLFLILMSSGSVLLYGTNVLFIVFLILKYNKSIPINFPLLLILLLIGYETIHVAMNTFNGYDDDIIKLLGFSICLIPFIFIKEFAKNINLTSTFNYLVAGFIGFTLITFGMYILHYEIGNYFDVIRRFGFLPNADEDSTLLINPNTIGKYSAFILSSFLVLINTKQIKVNLLSVLIIIYTLVIGLLTVSRVFLLILIIILIMYVLNNILAGHLVQSLSVIIGFSALTLIVLVTSNQLLSNLSDRIFKTDDISGSRLEIYRQYFSTIINNSEIFSFGVGMQDYLDKMKIINPLINQNTHNILLEVITIWGVLGLSLIIVYVMYILIQFYLLKPISFQSRFLLMLPFISLVIAAMFGQFFVSYYHTFGVMVFSLLFMYNKEVTSNV